MIHPGATASTSIVQHSCQNHRLFRLCTLTLVAFDHIPIAMPTLGLRLRRLLVFPLGGVLFLVGTCSGPATAAVQDIPILFTTVGAVPSW